MDHDRVKMSWMIDWANEEVLFHIANAFEDDITWFSLGFSMRGAFERSDVCIFQWQNEIFNSVIDGHVSDDGQTISFEEQQDCHLLRMDDNSIAFKRKFDTCDPYDMQMHEGTMYVTWARGTEELDLENGEINSPNTTQDGGMHMIQLLKADSLDVPEKWVVYIEIV